MTPKQPSAQTPSQDEHFMELALEACRRGIDAGQTPFGACIVRGDTVIACEHNRVWLNTDITAHAEVVALRTACRNLRSIDLTGCTIYSTTEPCPMCFSAIHWARIDRIVYGARIADAQAAGFNELAISNQQLKELSHAPIHLHPGCLTDRCVALFRRWRNHPHATAY